MSTKIRGVFNPALGEISLLYFPISCFAILVLYYNPTRRCVLIFYQEIKLNERLKKKLPYYDDELWTQSYIRLSRLSILKKK